MIRIDGYPIDVALNEKLTYEADVTEFPIEVGSDRTDHIRRKRPVYEIDGLVSDTPTGEVALDPTRQAEAGAPLLSQDAFQFLVATYEAGQPVIIETSYGKFEEMALQLLTPTRDKTSTKAFKFSATFKQIKVTENKRTTVRVAVPNAAGKQNLGHLESKRSTAAFATDEDVKYVISFPSSQRTAVTKSYGPPILTTTPEQRAAAAGDLSTDEALGTLDHYAVIEQATPDGYVAGGEYFALTKQQAANIGDELEGTRYDQSTGTWRGPGGQPVTKIPPATPGGDTTNWNTVTNPKAGR